MYDLTPQTRKSTVNVMRPSPSGRGHSELGRGRGRMGVQIASAPTGMQTKLALSTTNQSTIFRAEKKDGLKGTGSATFEGFPNESPGDIALIPEEAKGTRDLIWNVRNGVEYTDLDGFWYRYHYPESEWFKVPGHCSVTITSQPGHVIDDSMGGGCSLGWVAGKYGWGSRPHTTKSPFIKDYLPPRKNNRG